MNKSKELSAKDFIFVSFFIFFVFALTLQYFGYNLPFLLNIPVYIIFSLICTIIAIALYFKNEKYNFISNRESGDKNNIYTELFQCMNSQKEHFNGSVDNLQNTGFINLIIGMIVGIIGIALLIYLLNADKPSDNTDFLRHYLPKVSIFISIELLAYFFLRLYRLTLIEIKYLNNEITTYTHKMIALRVALLNGEKPKILTNIISELANTERNFILHKGETTTGSEGLKHLSEDAKMLMSFAAMLKPEESKSQEEQKK